MIKDTMNTFGAKIKGLWDRYKSNKLIWTILAAVVIVILIIALGGKDTGDSSTAVVERQDVVDSIQLSGRTQSASAVSLGFADQGRVASVNVKEGDTVRQGQVLASLDTSDLSASLQNARASLTIAKAGLVSSTTSLENITKEQDALVANAYRNLLSTGLQAVPENLSTTAPTPVISGSYTGPEGEYRVRVYASGTNSGASFEVQGLESGYIQSVTPNTSVPLGSRGLYIQFGDSGAYGGTTWIVSIPNKRSPSYVTALNAYNAAQAARDRAIADAQSDLDANSAESSIAQARVQQAEASVSSILSQINRRRIIAPFAGVVASANLKPGQSTSAISTSGAAGTTENSITLISENDYEVLLKAPEIDVAKLSVGQSVDISLDAYGDETFPGTIISINPAETIVDGVPVYETKVTFTNPDERVRSGMTATATIVPQEVKDALAIPANFIHTDKNESYVYVLSADGKKTEKRMITTGLRGSDSRVEIVSGLSEGETVRVDEIK